MQGVSDTHNLDDTWEFVYMRNVDIGRMPEQVLQGIWCSLGVDREKVACSSAIGAYLAEFIVQKDYIDEFAAILSAVSANSPLDVSLSISVDYTYSPIAPHRRVIPVACAVPGPAMAALDRYARKALEKRWAAIYHSSTRPGVRRLIRTSLAKYSLALPLLPNTPPRHNSANTNILQSLPASPPRPGSDIVHQRTPNHAILSKDHLAEIIPRRSSSRLVIYTDGAYLPDRRTAGVGAYFEGTDIAPIAERLNGHQSPARAEIHAMVMALKHILSVLRGRQSSIVNIREIWVCTDSQYAVDGVNLHREAWLQTNWLTSKGRLVANRTAFQLLFDSIQQLADRGFIVFVHHLPAHAGIAGNEIADMLAKAGALL
ncbi:Ribonuclease H1 [Coemansia sp. RSA 1365]|nr:Ribonuclease H1 [Coemansia sp. RSA 1365]